VIGSLSEGRESGPWDFDVRGRDPHIGIIADWRFGTVPGWESSRTVFISEVTVWHPDRKRRSADVPTARGQLRRPRSQGSACIGGVRGRQDAGATSDDPVADGVQHGFQAGMGARPAQDVADVVADGGRADLQFGGDLLGGTLARGRFCVRAGATPRRLPAARASRLRLRTVSARARTSLLSDGLPPLPSRHAKLLGRTVRWQKFL
jgi:hypothetical protein